MKIMIVCPKLSHGGAERVGVVLANGFALRKHQVTVVADLTKPVTYKLDEQIKLLNLAAYDYKSKCLKWLFAIKTLRSYIKAEKPDVIIGILELFSFLSKIAALGTGTPVIATEHDSFERPSSAPMGFVEKFFKFHVNKWFGIVTVLTAADKKFISKRLKNVVVMPNPLCMPILHDVPAKEKIVLAAGRLDAWHYKGFDLLIKAWSKVNAKFPDWKLNIAGVWLQEASKEFLNSIAKESKCDKSIEYLGFQVNMLPFYQRSSVFVLSSRYEGFGLVLIEAMSQGCACVACDYKGRQSEILEDGKDGMLCPVDSVEHLADALEKMIKDDELRYSYQQNAIHRAAYYSVENTIDRWEKLLKR